MRTQDADPHMDPRRELTVDELRAFHRVTVEADKLLEECVRDRMSLRATFERFLPALEDWLGARGAIVVTRDESLYQESFHWGAPIDSHGAAASGGDGCELTPSGDTLLWQGLDLAGAEVGRIEVLLRGDRTGEAALVRLLLDAACEELDAILATVHAAGRKQRLILEVTEQLRNPVFDAGVDAAVSILHREVGLTQFALLYRDATDPRRLQYRTYENGALVHDEERAPHPGLQRAVRDAVPLLDVDEDVLAAALGFERGIEQVLISGLTRSERIGKVACTGGAHGLSTYALDVVEILCTVIGQRLVDFNRERRDLAQFFSPRAVSALLRDAGYLERWLTPREETVAVLYADINSFTKICEQILVEPAAIGRFIDRWSAGAVERLWAHGGVFDKMVGDCVIGTFGPPFFTDSVAERAQAAVTAARAIAQFTEALEAEPPFELVPRSGVVPGMGVAIGLNLCPMSVGLFGPNQDYTGFSSGMNATARLQALAGFRETFAMEGFCEALGAAAAALGVRLGEPMEAAVKNVKDPLRYRRVTFEA